MEKENSNFVTRLIEGFITFLRRQVCSALSFGPIPRHIAFIMDGNRRYAKEKNLEEGVGHRFGSVALTNMLKYCYEMKVKYVTIYAFSIDNFKRRPEEVQSTLNLIHEKIEGLIEKESIINYYGVRVHFSGNLNLLSDPIKLSAMRVMRATENNSKCVLSICIAYTSRDEIVHAVEEAFKEKQGEFQVLEQSGGAANDLILSVEDVEKHMYMGNAPDPDIIIRTSGETRLSNFLLWQSATSILYSPSVLWPEIGFWHLARAILDFQRNFDYFEKMRKVKLV